MRKLIFAGLCLLSLLLFLTCSPTEQINKIGNDKIGPTKKKSNDVNRLELLNRVLVPKKGMDKTLTERFSKVDKRQYSIIQFSRKLKPEDFKSIQEMDVRLLGNIKGNFYYASLPPNFEINKTGIISWIEPFRKEDVIRNSLLEGKYNQLNIDSISGKLNVLVQFFEDVDRPTVLSNFKQLGLDAKRYGHKNSWSISLDFTRLKELLQLEGIKYIEEGPEPFSPLNNSGRRRANTDKVQNPTWGSPAPTYELSGDGIRVGICDNGVDEAHNDFNAINTDGTLGATRLYNVRSGPNNPCIVNHPNPIFRRDTSHGSHVASIVGGSGFNSANNNYPAYDLRGHAPLAQLGDYSYFNGTAQLYYDAIVGDDTDLTNHSYVETRTINYSLKSQNIDAIIRGDGEDDAGNAIPRRPQVWAAGNNGLVSNNGNLEEGFYSVFTAAKNSISVGSIDSENGRVSDFSSLGPTFDGRIKPDIVAPGCINSITNNDRILAARCASQRYIGKCGTSMAAPAVSGVIALMMEAYNNNNSRDAASLNPSTYKAILINTATDLVKISNYSTAQEFNNPDTGDPLRFYEGPDFSSGYGLINAEKAINTISRRALWLEGTYSTSDISYTFNVPEGSEDVQITLAWDDEAGDPSIGVTTSQLVNDLDLKLVDPNGNEYLPWVLDPLPVSATPSDGSLNPIATSDIEPAYKGEDRRNNVEMVTVCTPMSGKWKIKIEGFNLPNGNSQRYSIASSHTITRFISPVFDLCERYPQICNGPWLRKPPVFYPGDKIWDIPPFKSFIPVDDICLYVLDCPGCENFWRLCPGYSFSIEGIPSEAIVSIINGKGKTIASDKSKNKIRTLKTGSIIGGQSLYFVVEDKNKNLVKEHLKLKINRLK